MRPGATFVHHAPPPHVMSHVTGWKSPVPYLFGGLAAMLGLIAFALLILACSYWKLSGYVDPARDGPEGDDKKPKTPVESVFMKSILVIMPGDEKPTRLATPANTLRTTSSGGVDDGCSPDGEGKREKVDEIDKT